MVEDVDNLSEESVARVRTYECPECGYEMEALSPQTGGGVFNPVEDGECPKCVRDGLREALKFHLPGGDVPELERVDDD